MKEFIFQFQKQIFYLLQKEISKAIDRGLKVVIISSPDF